jgi:hypothetical protein
VIPQKGFKGSVWMAAPEGSIYQFNGVSETSVNSDSSWNYGGSNCPESGGRKPGFSVHDPA